MTDRGVSTSQERNMRMILIVHTFTVPLVVVVWLVLIAAGVPFFRDNFVAPMVLFIMWGPGIFLLRSSMRKAGMGHLRIFRRRTP